MPLNASSGPRVPRDGADPRRYELLEVARQVFSERGFDGSGMREIASRMGLLGGSLYYYVGSKQALLDEVMEAVEAPSSGLLTAAARLGGDFRTRFRALVRSHVVAVAADPLGVTLLFTQRNRLLDARRDVVNRKLREYRIGVEGMIRDAQLAGEVRTELDPLLSTMAVLGAVNWTSRWLRPGGSLTPERIGDVLADLLLDGVAAGRPIPITVVVADPVDVGEAPGDRRGLILRAAAVLFDRLGFESASMAGIASRAGIAKATLYHHFPTKEAILFALVDETQTVSLRRTRAIVHEPMPALRRLDRAIQNHIQYIGLTVPNTNLVLHDLRSLSPVHREAMHEAGAAYTALFEQLVDQASNPAGARQTAVTTRGILGAVNWMHRWYRPDGVVGTDQIARQFSDLLINGLTAAPPGDQE